MTPVFQKHFEKVLFSTAALALLAGTGWTWRQERSLRAALPGAAAPALSTAAYVPADLMPRANAAAVWRKAPAQAAGSGGMYELFTPPDGSVGAPESDLGLQLVAVQLEPYRLQLAGYFGSPDDYVAAFTIPGSPGTVLARAGQRFASLGLTLKNFEVRKVAVEHGDPWPVYDVVGLATLQDERTGTEVVIDTRTRKFTHTPLAVLQMPGWSETRELHEGDTWVEASATYRVERIQLEPAEVVIGRIMTGVPVPETRTLRPLTATAGQDRPTLHSRNVANNRP